MLWHLPLSVGFSLQHAVLVKNGAKTVQRAGEIKRDLANLQNLLSENCEEGEWHELN